MQHSNHQITFSELSVTQQEVYEAMGYGAETPGEDIREIVEEVLEHVASFMIGRFTYFTTSGTLDKNTLQIAQTALNIGSIISRQLKGSEAFVLFAATAGQEFEEWMEKVKCCDDIVLQFIADSLGSCLAEKVADYMENCLATEIASEGLKHTNRFSPGYCDWHVSEQQKLFSLFPTPSPCGIRLTESSLMIPIKSVSGIIGIGTNVKRMEYSCGLCTFERCYKKKALRDHSGMS